MNDQHSMNPDVARKLLQVGEAFRIPGPFFSYEEIKMGNVNHTYKVNYIRDDGSGMAKIKSYLVQRVNTYALPAPAGADEQHRQGDGVHPRQLPHGEVPALPSHAGTAQLPDGRRRLLAAEQLRAVGDVQQLRGSGDRCAARGRRSATSR